jgi:hypothetical protein
MRVPSNARIARSPSGVVVRQHSSESMEPMEPMEPMEVAPESTPAPAVEKTSPRRVRVRERSGGGEDLNREMLELLHDLRNEVKELRKDVDKLKENINATVVTTPLVLSSLSGAR